jgi:hypothetical protein
MVKKHQQGLGRLLRGAPAPNRSRGRPRALSPTEATLAVVESLGMLHATTMECAAFLGVDENTYIAFRKRNPEVQAAFERGRGNGKISLRRIQLRLARKNAAMAIFLGKNLLDQRDTFTPMSPTGGTLEIVHRLLAMNDGKTRLLPPHALKNGEPGRDAATPMSGRTED